MEGRKNAMLTTEDRRWLTGEKEYTGDHAKQQRYQRRRDIRERVRNSVLDFTILFDDLEEQERERIFDSITSGDEPDRELEDGVRDGLAFLLYVVGITDLMDSGTGPNGATVAEEMLADAVVRAGSKDGFLVEEVRLEVEATERSADEVIEKVESDEAISPKELQYLLENEMIDMDALRSCLRTALADREGGEPTDDD